MKLRITLAATRHLNAIHAHIANDDTAAADRTVTAIRTACRRLVEFPYLGRPGPEVDQRTWSMARLPYRVVYRADAARGELVILAVFHSRRGPIRE